MPHKYKGSQKTPIKNYMPEIGNLQEVDKFSTVKGEFPLKSGIRQ